MAELLVKASDTINPDAVRDLRGCYKNGDVVVVKPDGWSWGKEELNKEKFYILHISDRTAEELQFLTEPDEMIIGTRYIAEAPELGIMVDSLDSESAVISTCENMASAVVAALKKNYGLDVSYNVKTRSVEIRLPIVKRRVMLDIGQVENDLKSGIVKTTSDKINLVEKSSDKAITLADKLSEMSVK